MVEVGVTDQGTFEVLMDKWDIFVSLLALGFGIAVVVTVVAAAFKLGTKLWPWVLAAALIAWVTI